MFQEVVAFLSPFFARESEREAALLNAFYDHEAVLRKINYAGAASEFVPRLVRVLQHHGEIAPRTQALWQLLLSIKEQVGLDKQRQVDRFQAWANTSHGVTLQPGDLAGSTVVNNDNRTTITGGQFGSVNNYGDQTNNFGPQTNQTTQSGNNISVSGNDNTVAGGSIDQSRHNNSNIRINGNVQGGNVNIGGNQTFKGNVTVTMGDMTQTIQKGSAALSDKEELQAMIDKLQAELQSVPAAHKEAAETVSKRTTALVEEASDSDVDPTSVKSKAERLKQAAENIKVVMPTVTAIALGIVGQVLKMGGLS